MGAPTNAAYVKKVLANSEPSTHGGIASVTGSSLMLPINYFLAQQIRDCGGGIMTLCINRSRAKVQPNRSTLRSRRIECCLEFNVQRPCSYTAPIHRAEHQDVADRI
jgi:hypothetical protein